MIRLFKNYYIDPDPSRDEELVEVRRRDQHNPLIGDIAVVEGRPTFADIFRRVNEADDRTVMGAAFDVNIVANSDIYFDDSLSGPGLDLMQPTDAYALTRWEEMPEGITLKCDDKGVPRIDSQDAWVFRGPIRQEAIDKSDFLPGVRGCDNRLCAVLAEAGYNVSNPSKSIRAIHLHRTEVRHYTRSSPFVPKPYLLIPPHELGEKAELRWSR